MPHNTYPERRKARPQARHPNPSEEGYFVSPTVFDGVSSEMSIAWGELFGPVLSQSAHVRLPRQIGRLVTL